MLNIQKNPTDYERWQNNHRRLFFISGESLTLSLIVVGIGQWIPSVVITGIGIGMAIFGVLGMLLGAIGGWDD